jgi:hypothetical protein
MPMSYYKNSLYSLSIITIIQSCENIAISEYSITNKSDKLLTTKLSAYFTFRYLIVMSSLRV